MILSNTVSNFDRACIFLIHFYLLREPKQDGSLPYLTSPCFTSRAILVKLRSTFSQVSLNYNIMWKAITSLYFDSRVSKSYNTDISSVAPRNLQYDYGGISYTSNNFFLHFIYFDGAIQVALKVKTDIVKYYIIKLEHFKQVHYRSATDLVFGIITQRSSYH